MNYGIFSALQSITRTGALNVLYGLKSGGGESKGAVLKWGGASMRRMKSGAVSLKGRMKSGAVSL